MAKSVDVCQISVLAPSWSSSYLTKLSVPDDMTVPLCNKCRCRSAPTDGIAATRVGEAAHLPSILAAVKLAVCWCLGYAAARRHASPVTLTI